MTLLSSVFLIFKILLELTVFIIAIGFGIGVIKRQLSTGVAVSGFLKVKKEKNLLLFYFVILAYLLLLIGIFIVFFLWFYNLIVTK